MLAGKIRSFYIEESSQKEKEKIKDMNKKTVSVIMGFYNNESTLARAIDSIINQTFNNWELILCDDGSNDGSYSIANNYLNRYPDKIKLLRNKKNMHLAAALNKCLSVATGEYIARMDADDESLPDRFEKQLSFLEKHPEFILCGTDIIVADEISGIEKRLYSIPFPDRFTLYKHTPFNHATILCRRRLLSDLGGYTESRSVFRCEDKDLWYRFFAFDYKGANINEPLYKVYENEASIYRRTPRSRWNIFITNLRGFKLLKYPWYWYHKPFINLTKVFIPRTLLVYYKKKKKRVDKK